MIAGFQALSGKHRAVRLTGTGLVRQNTHRRASLEQVRQMGRFACVRGTDRHNLHMARAIAAPKALVAKVQCVTLLQPAPIRVRPQALRHHTASRPCNRSPARSIAIPSIRRRGRATLSITVASTTATDACFHFQPMRAQPAVDLTRNSLKQPQPH
ncbi:MAG: hypothetical protein GDA35_09355 [Hyphomonadaceae bacterium]|nr:hypothetical protein [Hyphomonadaceae bacterium]